MNERFVSEGVLVSSSSASYHARAFVGADGSNGAASRFICHLDKFSCTARLLEVAMPGDEHEVKFTQHFASFDFSPSRDNV